MNKSFLDCVATDLLQKYGTNMSRIAIVFPNKRASLFLNDHLVQKTDAPIWTPAYFTISDLFRAQSSLTVADPIKLVCDLHKSFIKCTGINESIDHFYGWGQLLLADFDDIDKNMADAKKIFQNIENLHELDDTSYLTAEQREMLKKFFANFADDDTELKRRFISLWKHIADIYNDFNKRLKQQELAYEGSLYRAVATDDSVQYPYDVYIFVGFNLLHVVEQQLFKTLKQQGKAKFYWDYDRYYMPHKNMVENEAGHFIAQYLELFPNEFDNTDNKLYDNLGHLPKINIVSASTDTVQAAFMTHWLQEDNAQRIAKGKETAIVMCDENILQTLMHALPDKVQKANITTGFPLQQTAVTSFVSQLIALQTLGYNKGSHCFIMHHVLKILRHPYMAYLTSENTSLADALYSKKRYYPSMEELAIDDATALIFKDINTSSNTDASTYNSRLFEWLQQVLKLLGIKAPEADALFVESVFRMYTLVSRLLSLIQEGELEADLSTILRLFTQLVSGTSIPFHGEPIEGIQVMGVLETRNLDFKHLLILSCNESKMPKSVNDASFIPYTIRKAYGLTTIDHKVAIYAYYFNRLLQRATDVTIVYTTSTDDMKVGEKSRFITQLMVESNIVFQHFTLQAEHASLPTSPVTIEKTEAIMQELNNMTRLSPTAINKYMRCPLSFYYYHVAHIHEYIDEEQLSMDNRIFGNIFHKASETIYRNICDEKGNVYASSIEKILKQPHAIDMVVDEAFSTELFKISDSQRKPQYNGLQLINRAVIVRYVRNLLDLDKRYAPFRIIGLEMPVYDKFNVEANGKTRTLEVGGLIDRLDMIVDPNTREETIRVVDYKTGKEATRNVADVQTVFTRKDIGALHANYYLQAMLYSLIIRNDKQFNPRLLPVSPALLFIQHSHREGYDPTLTFKKDKIESRISDIKNYEDEFKNQLSLTINEIFDASRPFYPTTDNANCTNCPYRQLCRMKRSF